MNVQGRRGGLSCDNKGERLIHKKKKKKVVGTAAEQRQWPPCGDRSDPRPMTSGAEPSGRASFAPAIGTASGAGGKKTKADSTTARPEGAALWPGARESTGPAGGGEAGQEPLRRSAPSIVPPPARRRDTHACARAHTRARTHTRPQRAAPHAPARPRRTRLGSAPRAAPTRPGACPGPISARTHICTRRGTPGGGSSTLARAGTRAHADPRALSSSRSAVFFMNENVVCK